MKTIRITGVPEHFNYPWKKIVKEQPFLARGVLLHWIDESKGSGQMNKALRADETELAVVLTESFLKDVSEGNSARMLGFHVKSPLIWGIHLPAKSKINHLNEIENPRFLVSRMGSGSHLMASVLARKENWNLENLSFRPVENMDGALKCMDPQNPELFLWEKYTTKPWVDAGQLKRIGEVASPWPCFVTVATQKARSEFGNLLFELRDLVFQVADQVHKDPRTPEQICETYQLKLEDVKKWLSETIWETSATISKLQLEKAMEKMVELRILKKNLSFDEFIFVDGIKLL